MSLLLDWRNQLSWGRFCALVALVMAVKVQLSGGSVAHVSLWLGTALGNYGLSKATEMVVAPSVVVVATPAPGLVVPETSPAGSDK